MLVLRPALAAEGVIPVRAVFRFSSCVVGGLSLSGVPRIRPGRANPRRRVARTPLLLTAFDVALDAKNSLSVSAMAANLHPLALFLNSSASLPHLCRIFLLTMLTKHNYFYVCLQNVSDFFLDNERQKMRVTAIGVKRMSGVGKDSGRPFDFSRMTILRQMEVVAGEKFQLSGYGYETADLDVENEALPQFAQIKFPAQLDLVVDTVPGRNGLRSVVTGIKQAA